MTVKAICFFRVAIIIKQMIEYYQSTQWAATFHTVICKDYKCIKQSFPVVIS